MSDSLRPQNCSTPGLPVHHLLPEFTQTHVHRVGDAIQPSHPLLSPFPPAPNPSSIRVFSNESTLHTRWPKYWSFSFSISPSNEHPGLVRWWNSSWAISNPERWCCESAALNMPANWENSAVATGLEKVSFHSNPKERQGQRMFKLPHNCTHLTC